jgi:hypothetical protein
VIVKYSQKKNLKNLLSNFNISNKEEQNKIKENGKKEKIVKKKKKIKIKIKYNQFFSFLKEIILNTFIIHIM